MTTYKFKVEKSNIRQCFQFAHPKGLLPEKTISNLVNDHNLNSGDIIELKVVNVERGENNEKS